MQSPDLPMPPDMKGYPPLPMGTQAPQQDVPPDPAVSPIIPGPSTPPQIGPAPTPPPSEMPKQIYAHPKMRPAGKAPFSKSNVRHDGRNYSPSAKPPSSVAAAHSQRHVVKGPS